MEHVATKATEREKEMLQDLLLVTAPFAFGILLVAMGADITDNRFKNEAVECPNHEGSFDCTPFCPLCEGNQEIAQTN